MKTIDCSYYKVHATRTDCYAKLKTLFPDNFCKLLLCSTSVNRVMYCLGYADAALELVDLTLLYVQYTNLEILFLVNFYGDS